MITDDEFLDLFKRRKFRNNFSVTWEEAEETECMTLVLGNGFDLQCGLKTTYNNFFDYSINEVVGNNDKIYKTIQTIFQKKNCKKYRTAVVRDLYKRYRNYLSVWDIYFIHEEIRTDCWADIERLMKKSLEDDKFWDDVDDEFCKMFSNKHKRRKIKNYKLNLCDFLASLIFERYCLKDNKIIGRPDWEKPEEFFYDKLLEELNIFEKRFGNYVRKQYEENKDQYIQVSRENIKRIYQDGTEKSNSEIGYSILRIISFNYIPLIDENLLDENEKFIHYIHCDLDNPIFCIDKVDERGNHRINYYNKFSSENRELNLGIYNLNDIFQTNTLSTSILTYGLSFSDVDVQDFKKIFLNKNTGPNSENDFRQIISYYSDMGKNNKNKTRDFLCKNTENLQKLIKRFGGSINYTSLVQGPCEKIRAIPIKLKTIEKNNNS